MAQSLSNILLHIVFSTKCRKNLLSKDFQPTLHAYIAGICNEHQSNALRVGGTDNHIHIACSLHRTITIAKLLEEIKKNSSKWVKENNTKLPNFSWQAGYGAFSLGESQVNSLIKYINNQEEHHRTKSFKEEYLELLHHYNVNFDENHLWD